jgi:hypothetical protein
MHEVANTMEFDSGQLGAFWMTLWSHIGLYPDLYPAS